MVSRHPLLASCPHRNPSGRLLSRGNERFEMSPLIKQQTCHYVFTQQHVFSAFSSVNWAITSGLSRFPRLLFIRGLLNKLCMKKVISVFSRKVYEIIQYQSERLLFGLSFSSLSNIFIHVVLSTEVEILLVCF